jgi:hypothetical protein
MFNKFIRQYIISRVDNGEVYMRFGCGSLGYFWWAVGRDGIQDWQYDRLIEAVAKDIIWC